MRKLTMTSILLLISVIVLLPLAAIGLRDVLLRQTDCFACRQIVSLGFRPSDYNAPIVMSQIEKGTSHFYLFPRYVGPYFLEVYGASGNSEVAVVSLDCSENVGFKAVPGPNEHSKVFSSFGHGFILGGLHVLPKQVATKDRIACDIKITSMENMLLVITRASEL